MKLNVRIILGSLLFFFVINFSYAEKDPKSLNQRDCTREGAVIRGEEMIDKDGDGKWETIRRYYCDWDLPPKDIPMEHPFSVIPTNHFGNLDPSESRINTALEFTFQSITPMGITEERDVHIFVDSLAGRCGIIYSSLAKDFAGNYIAFYEPTQVPNPNNFGWTFADVHGVPFYDSVRGTMVNELYENITNALVGIQYFPNGGDAITFFFYPKN